MNYKFGYKELQESTSEFQEIFPEMIRSLEDEDYVKYKEESDGHKDAPFRALSDVCEGENKEGELNEHVEDVSGVQGVINGAKTATMATVATMAAVAQRLAKVASYVKYEYSDRAMIAKKIRDAMNIDNLTTVTGKICCNYPSTEFIINRSNLTEEIN